MTRVGLIAGSTGLVGRAVLDLLVSDPRYDLVHNLVRREQPARPKVQTHVVDFDALTSVPAADDVYCCLGTTIKIAGSQEAFRNVDHDYVLAVARLAREAGATRFLLVSSIGADAGSAVFYNRVKGEIEAAVTALGYPELTIARPSMLDGDRAATGQAARTGEGIALRMLRPISGLIPLKWRPIAADTVARALIRRAFEPGPPIVESAELQALGTVS